MNLHLVFIVKMPKENYGRCPVLLMCRGGAARYDFVRVSLKIKKGDKNPLLLLINNFTAAEL